MKYAFAASLALAILACWKWFRWWKTCDVLADILVESIVENLDLKEPAEAEEDD